jgi:hypothetical protein
MVVHTKRERVPQHIMNCISFAYPASWASKVIQEVAVGGMYLQQQQVQQFFCSFG